MKLIFVYNAKSGKLNTLLDTGHKLLSPSTSKCRLCQLTHDTFLEARTWKSFREQSEFTMEFYHKDEFKQKYPKVVTDYPVIMTYNSGELKKVLSNKVLEEILDTNHLIKELKSIL